jgi:hypothetical protein
MLGPKSIQELHEMRREISRLASKIDSGLGQKWNDKRALTGGTSGGIRRAKRVRVPAAASGLVELRIEGFSSPSALSGGWYWAQLTERSASDFNPSSNFNATTYFSNVSRVIVFNLMESGSASHDLLVSGVVWAKSTGETITVSSSDYDVYETSGWSFCV